MGTGFLLESIHLASTYAATALIRRNIITNTKKALYPGVGSGSGIADLTGGRYTIIAEENCLWGNLTDLYKVIQTDGLYVDPQFSGFGDYHLQLSSPCRFSGYQLGCYEDAEQVPAKLLISLKETQIPELIKLLPKKYTMEETMTTVIDLTYIYTTKYTQYDEKNQNSRTENCHDQWAARKENQN